MLHEWFCCRLQRKVTNEDKIIGGLTSAPASQHIQQQSAPSKVNREHSRIVIFENTMKTTLHDHGGEFRAEWICCPRKLFVREEWCEEPWNRVWITPHILRSCSCKDQAMLQNIRFTNLEYWRAVKISWRERWNVYIGLLDLFHSLGMTYVPDSSRPPFLTHTTKRECQRRKSRSAGRKKRRDDRSAARLIFALPSSSPLVCCFLFSFFLLPRSLAIPTARSSV